MILDRVTDFLLWAAAACALIACYYSTRFVLRYRRVNWQGSPWGRHVMRFSILIAVSMATAVLLRVLALIDFDSLFARAVIGVTIYGWVAYEMRRRFYLERETQHQMKPDGPLKKLVPHPPRHRKENEPHD